MANEKIFLEIITPERTILQEEGIDMVVIQRAEQEEGEHTEVGILPHHAPMLVRLPVTPVRYKKEGKTYYLVVAAGFLEVKDNRVIILSPAAERVEVVDMAVAQVARERAEKWLSEMAGKAEFDARAAEVELKRAMVDLYRSDTERSIGKIGK